MSNTGIFNKEKIDTITQPEDSYTTLQNEVAELTRLARFERDPIKLAKLQAERAELMPELYRLQAEHDKNQKTNEYHESESLLRDNIAYWVFEVNGVKTPIDPKTLSVKIKYRCSHEEIIYLNDLILFEKNYLYRDLMTTDYSISQSRTCPKCRVEKKERLERQGLYSPFKPAPQIRWKLRYLK